MDQKKKKLHDAELEVRVSFFRCEIQHFLTANTCEFVENATERLEMEILGVSIWFAHLVMQIEAWVEN
jgi:hypothetical protein